MAIILLRRLVIYAGYCTMFCQGSDEKCDFFPSCKCQQDNFTHLFNVNCFSIGLMKIPRFPNVIQSLVLQGNRISEVENDTFKNNSFLRILDLSQNKIFVLWTRSFEGLNDLHSLDISDNYLSSDNKSFQNGCFSPLRKLEHLNLKKNKPNEDQIDLSSLVSLKSLRMDIIAVKEGVVFRKEYSALKHLTILDVSGSTGICSINNLIPESFESVIQIEELDLSFCNINKIQRGTFSKMKNITHLDISGNICLQFKEFGNVTHDLQFSAIKVLKLNKIYSAYHLNTILPTDVLKPLINTTLKELYCDANRIQIIEAGGLTYLPNTLQHISMRKNELSFGTFIFDVSKLSIKSADLSLMYSFHNPFEYLLHCPSHQAIQERSIYADNSKYHLTPPNLARLKHLSLKTNYTWVLPVPENVSTLVYKECGMRYKIRSLTITNNIIEDIDVSRNAFYSWIGPIRNLNHLKHVNLSHNLCSFVSQYFFSPDMVNLRTLHVQNNMLGTVLSEDVDGKILDNLHNLEEINLSQNRIPTLPRNFFKAQSKMKCLNLKNNLLETIVFRISHMTNLKILYLSNNKLLHINSYARQQLNSLKRQSDFSINLENNPLQCTCDDIKFVKWMVSTESHLENVHLYTCESTKGKKQILVNVMDIYLGLKKACYSYDLLAVGISGTILIFISILCGGLVYRYRWKIRYFYYMVKIRHHERRPNLWDDDCKDYMYDVFVSYADDDRFFVHTTLLQKLEKEAGIELCLHFRNFLPGNDIATNIISAIHNSRKTVIIMSNNFLNSYWGMYEFNMAKMESIYERRKENILFLVFYEQIQTRDLPLQILELVQSQSYIEYPNDEHGNEVFWNQLITALRS
ncbi:unnamed protein product [Mytilus coruscus]|uniref:TIR domain-containing protein n=1 Tax=Mytilus coruscus TaxID=42192 RepID=A0A6J8DJW4_MYTCO|nr:unnamed protein product [Mytilus coruscus]